LLRRRAIACSAREIEAELRAPDEICLEAFARTAETASDSRAGLMNWRSSLHITTRPKTKRPDGEPDGAFLISQTPR
jgi:hypothetical protein